MIIKFYNGKGSIVGTEDGAIRIMHPNNPRTVLIESEEALKVLRYFLNSIEGVPF